MHSKQFQDSMLFPRIEFHTVPEGRVMPSGGADFCCGGDGALTGFFGDLFIIEGMLMILGGLVVAIWL